MSGLKSYLEPVLSVDHAEGLRGVFDLFAKMAIEEVGSKYSNKETVMFFANEVFAASKDQKRIPRQCFKELAKIFFREMRKEHSASILFHGCSYATVFLLQAKREEEASIWIKSLVEKCAECREEWQILRENENIQAARDLMFTLADVCFGHGKNYASPKFSKDILAFVTEKLGEKSILHYLNEYQKKLGSVSEDQYSHRDQHIAIIDMLKRRISFPEIKGSPAESSRKQDHLKLV